MHPIPETLARYGWMVDARARTEPLPPDVTNRYPNLPRELRDFIGSSASCVSSDEQTWFLGWKDFQPSEDGIYSWNEWERLSLESAAGDDDWMDQIRQFWNLHFPIAQAVRGPYAYVAVKIADRQLPVVYGLEPEFEEPVVVAPALSELPRLIDRIFNEPEHSSPLRQMITGNPA